MIGGNMSLKRYYGFCRDCKVQLSILGLGCVLIFIVMLLLPHKTQSLELDEYALNDTWYYIDSDLDGYNNLLEMLRGSDSNDVSDTPIWTNDLLIRNIDLDSGKLISQVSSYGYRQSNDLLIKHPALIDSFGADVEILAIASKESHTEALLSGVFYSSNGKDVLAEVGIQQTTEGLKIFTSITSGVDDWHYEYAPALALRGQVYELKISYSRDDNMFTFDFGTPENPSFLIVTGPNKTADSPSYNYKSIGTRVGGFLFGPDSGGVVVATFDNVIVNGSYL
jgi:hypothetical protein